MDIGNVIQQLTDFLAKKSEIKPENVILSIQRDLMFEDFFLEWDLAAVRAENLIGYLAGNFPPSIGNMILSDFNVSHPYFGKKIPDDADAWLEAGKKAGAAILEAQAEIEALRRKNEKEEKLGFKLPELDSTVDNETAKDILNRLKEKRELIANLEEIKFAR